MTPKAARWERVAQREDPSWYLDPLVARQKAQLHLELAREWAGGGDPARVLKTDVFEDAYGDDRLLVDLLPGAQLRIGIDVAPTTAGRDRAARWNLCSLPRRRSAQPALAAGIARRDLLGFDVGSCRFSRGVS